jgi:DNA repair protein RadD
MLRNYQQRTIDEIYKWLSNHAGHPCVVMPTGSGKSHIVAALCKDALQQWPETRILMLTHVKELIEQNAEKMRQHWPDSPLGIYSASIGIKQMDCITFAGIQSIRKKADELGHVDLVIIDECHLVSHKDEGGYRTLLAALSVINPHLRVIGLTATPYRLGHGLITDKPALFDALIEPVSIEELIYKGYLAPLRSKVTSAKLDVSGVHKRGGEYIEAELQKAVNTDKNNFAVVEEVINLAGERKAWLFFCAGVDHAQNVAHLLNLHDILAACITGETPKAERERIIADFKAGKLRALTNANVLTTGFDYPDIDLIAMLRPTMSASLYVQMAGRGMRPKSHTDHCLVLDFAGVVATHGPITAVQPPRKGSSGNGEAPVKVCDACGELVHLSARQCPACSAPFPEPKAKKLKLHDDDIMGVDGKTLIVTSWTWRVHVSKSSGKEMLVVSFYGGLSDPVVREYLTVLHDGIAGEKARNKIAQYLLCSDVTPSNNLHDTAMKLNKATPPAEIEYKMDGQFFRVIRRKYANKAA